MAEIIKEELIANTMEWLIVNVKWYCDYLICNESNNAESVDVMQNQKKEWNKSRDDATTTISSLTSITNEMKQGLWYDINHDGMEYQMKTLIYSWRIIRNQKSK